MRCRFRARAYVNHYSLWVYPAKIDTAPPPGVTVARSLDAQDAADACRGRAGLADAGSRSVGRQRWKAASPPTSGAGRCSTTGPARWGSSAIPSTRRWPVSHGVSQQLAVVPDRHRGAADHPRCHARRLPADRPGDRQPRSQPQIGTGVRDQGRAGQAPDLCLRPVEAARRTGRAPIAEQPAELRCLGRFQPTAELSANWLQTFVAQPKK